MPHAFARSALYRSSNRSHEKLPSPSNGTSRSRKYRNASGPKRSIASFSSSLTSADLLKRSPPSATKPCAHTDSGSGSAAACSIAGQMMECSRVMSLPITCSCAGQRFVYDAPG